jgi:hypothetical protein
VEAAGVKNQGAYVALHLEQFDPQNNDLVIAGDNPLIDRAVEPDRGTRNEHGPGRAGFPRNAGKAIAELGG